MNNLWSEDIANIAQIDNESPSPVNILREQAQLLGKQTQGKVEAEVEANIDYDYNSDVDESFIVYTQEFKYNFYLTTPIIPGYRYKLFTISHDADLYPVDFHLDRGIADEINQGKKVLRAKSEEQFLDTLKKIFNSKKTSQVIRAILSQIQF
jgi:hypothetical protein